jgi:hypothetical protein
MDLHVESINERHAGDDDRKAWNEAYDRLVDFLSTFALGDHAYVSQVALEILRQAQEIHGRDPSREPSAVTMEQAQKRLADWLATNLGQENQSPSHVLATGYIALLLSRVNRTAPTSFLAGPLPEELRHALRETLLVTGPDLNVSSMTPRHLDYGPMLQLARQTWHRWNAKEVAVASLFWGAVYMIFYLWLSPLL